MGRNAADAQKKIFAHNLNLQLSLRELSQDDLAKALKCSSSTVSDWCNAKKYPRVNRMQQIADYFNVSLATLREEWNDEESFFEYAVNFQNEVSDRIKTRMKELGLTDKKVMEDLGFDKDTLDFYLSGQVAFATSNRFESNRIDDFAEELRTTSRYLLLRTNDPYDYDRDPKHYLQEIPADAYAELEKLYDGDRESIYREWSNGLRESYRSMFPFHNSAHFTTIRDDSADGKKRLVLIRDTESLRRLEPVARKLELLSPKSRNELIQLIEHVVDMFLSQT